MYVDTDVSDIDMDTDDVDVGGRRDEAPMGRWRSVGGNRGPGSVERSQGEPEETRAALQVSGSCGMLKAGPGPCSPPTWMPVRHPERPLALPTLLCGSISLVPMHLS